MIRLAAVHTLGTYIGGVIVALANWSACMGNTSATPMVIELLGLAAFAVLLWAWLAVRWRNPWVIGAGIIAAAPVLAVACAWGF